MKKALLMMLLALCLVADVQAEESLLRFQRLPHPKRTPPPQCLELGSGAPPPANTVTVINDTGSTITVHMGFLSNSCYQPSNFSFCTPGSNQYICTFQVTTTPVVLNFSDSTCAANFALAVNQDPWQGCSNTMAEFTLHSYWSYNMTYEDTIDVSLVNGFSYPMAISSSPSGASISATSATNNQTNIGVFPEGCTTCIGNTNQPCSFSSSECKTNQTEYPCQITQESGVDYTVTIGASGDARFGGER